MTSCSSDFSYSSFISDIGSAQSDVNTTMEAMQANADDPEKLLELSMELMQQQQKLTTMTESFTKAMKAMTDACKSAITNMA